MLELMQVHLVAVLFYITGSLFVCFTAQWHHFHRVLATFHFLWPEPLRPGYTHRLCPRENTVNV